MIQLVLAAAALAGLVLLTGCSHLKDGGSTGATELEPVAPGGRLTVGGANYTEMLVMQALYGNLLAKAGYQVTYSSVKDRAAYEPLLRSGEIDVVPELAATMAEYLNREQNGDNATVVASSDPGATVTAMRPLARWRGLSVLQPAAAADQNGFAVDDAFARKTGISSLSQFAALHQPVVLAATPGCSSAPFCQVGLQKVYGLQISKVLPTGIGTTSTKEAVLSGDATLGLVSTTDGSLASLGLRLLKDDRKLQLADNLVPVVNASADTAPVAAALNSLTGVLTTPALARLNEEVQVGQLSPDAVARSFLKESGLL